MTIELGPLIAGFIVGFIVVKAWQAWRAWRKRRRGMAWRS